MMKVLPVVALALAACVTEPAREPLEVAPVGDAAWSALVQRAADEWTAVGCEITEGEGLPVVAVPIAEWPYPSHWLGASNAQGVFVIAELDEPTRHRITLHELGHALGFSHRDIGIMSEHASADAVTAADCTPAD